MNALNRLQITWRAAQDILDGQVVNLGIGLPVHCSDYLRPELDVILQSENGVIGSGRWQRPTRPTPTWWMPAAGASRCGRAPRSLIPHGRSR
jgi:acyl CoA:acetate/3-ketoacid CoA transferase beta subunit